MPQHVQIVPIEHVPNTVSLSQTAAAEFCRYTGALKKCFDEKLDMDMLLFGAIHVPGSILAPAVTSPAAAPFTSAREQPAYERIAARRSGVEMVHSTQRRYSRHTRLSPTFRLCGRREGFELQPCTRSRGTPNEHGAALSTRRIHPYFNAVPARRYTLRTTRSPPFNRLTSVGGRGGREQSGTCTCASAAATTASWAPCPSRVRRGGRRSPLCATRRARRGSSSRCVGAIVERCVIYVGSPPEEPDARVS